VARILGLDIAISTGWALVEDGELHQYGAKKLKGKDGQRYSHAAQALNDLLDEHKPDLVAYEDVGFSRFYKAYGSFRALNAIYLSVCHSCQVPVAPVKTNSLKLWWTAHGGADKATMCEVARDWGGAEVYAESEGGTKSQEDMADAIAAAFWGDENFARLQTSVAPKRRRK
jgi:Holliday junction resolvasome RuvABC endonuclease subunit